MSPYVTQIVQVLSTGCLAATMPTMLRAGMLSGAALIGKRPIRRHVAMQPCSLAVLVWGNQARTHLLEKTVTSVKNNTASFVSGKKPSVACLAPINCSRSIALEGAISFERTPLGEALATLYELGFESVFLLEAGSEIESGLFTQLSRLSCAGAMALQCRLTALDQGHRSALSRIMAAWDRTSEAGREVLGYSAHTATSGLLLSREAFLRVPVSTLHELEDGSYLLRLLKADIKTRYMEQRPVAVREPRGPGAGRKTGTMRPSLVAFVSICCDLIEGRWQMLDMFFEALRIPVAIAVVLLAMAMAGGPAWVRSGSLVCGLVFWLSIVASWIYASFVVVRSPGNQLTPVPGPSIGGTAVRLGALAASAERPHRRAV